MWVSRHLNDNDLLQPAFDKLENFKGLEEVLIQDDTLQIRTLNAPSKLAGLLNEIEKIPNLEVDDMKIRKSTLEDVFLHLTGKQLRE